MFFLCSISSKSQVNRRQPLYSQSRSLHEYDGSRPLSLLETNST